MDFLSVFLRLCFTFQLIFLDLPYSAHSRKNKASMWWNLALMEDWSHPNNLPISSSLTSIPHYSQAFTKRQQQILHKNPGGLMQVVQAAKMAVAECRRQMSWRRWNCSTNPSLHPGRSIFGGIIRKGYRETSFLHALSSATLAYTVARACSEGLMNTCSCDTKQPNQPPSLQVHSMKKMKWLKENKKLRKEHFKKKRFKIMPKHQRERMRDRKMNERRWNEKRIKEGTNGRHLKRKRRRQRNLKRHSHRHPLFKNSQFGQTRKGVEEDYLLNAHPNNHLFIDHSDLTSNVGKKWQWGGCNDNIEFGYKFSRKFIDSSEQDRDLRCAVNKHNNEAGRQHVMLNIKPVCKCHGLSGSCSVKTCWIRLVPFWFIGHAIKLRFDGAAKVNHGNDILKAPKIKLQPVHAYQKPPSKRDLVYYEESPLFCEPNHILNHPGVQGKQCKANSKGLDGCDVMCCGRGFHSEVFDETQQCDCTFNYCCTVVCNKCTTRKTISYCL